MTCLSLMSDEREQVGTYGDCMLLFHHLMQSRLVGTLNALTYIFQTADLIRVRQRLISTRPARKFHGYHIQCPVQCPDSKRGRNRSKLTCWYWSKWKRSSIRWSCSQRSVDWKWFVQAPAITIVLQI